MLKKLSIAILFIIASAASAVAQINAEQVTTMGRNALYFDDYMVAIQYFNRAIGAKPYWAQPYFYRSIAKLSLDDFAGAEEDASLALERNPFITDAYEVRAVARQNLGKNREAITDYVRVLEDNPDNRNVLYNMAIAQVETSDTLGATTTFGRLLTRHPRFDGGYIARARFNMVTGDTLAALADADKAIALNANALNAYVLRAEINLTRALAAGRDNPEYPALDSMARADMDVALRLSPDATGLLINRAFMRYHADDYIGAMADYDRALEIDPTNIIALYNRAMLRAEVYDFNRAIDDFSAVIERNPDQYRAVFNRANLYREIGDWRRALDDINTVIAAFPDFAAAIYLRAEINHHLGNSRASDRDYKQSIALARKKVVMLPDADVGGAARQVDTAEADSLGIFAESQDEVAARFSSLLRVDDISAAPRDYSGSTRGHIQNTDFAVELEPMFTLSYYFTETELSSGTDFMRDLDLISASLHEPLYLVSHSPSLSDKQVAERAASVEYYNSWLATHSPRAVDYLALAIDHFTLHDYTSAVAALDRAISTTPGFAPALMMRGVARWRMAQSELSDSRELRAERRSKGIPDIPSLQSQDAVVAAIADFDAAIASAPRLAVAHYNKGYVLASARQWMQALDAFNRAIELDPAMGQAYYNRGYVNMMLGNKADAFTDLSRAGELGIAPAYNLIKRMSR